MVRDFFGIDDEFSRPLPEGWWRLDLLIAVTFLVLSLTPLLGMRQVPEVAELIVPGDYISLVIASCIIFFRRRFPVTTLLLAGVAHPVIPNYFFEVSRTMLILQVLYFVAMYSAMAWAKNRQALLMTMILVVLASTVALTTTSAQLISLLEEPPLITMVAGALNTLAYFAVSIWLGRASWLNARTTKELIESREVISRQADRLAEQAIVTERLRIARELHDSMAHHVALIGIQAGAARRTMAQRPTDAESALLEVEQNSRSAVAELRAVIGSLRSADGTDQAPASLTALPTLIEDNMKAGLAVHYDLVDDQDRLADLSTSQSATLFRVIQESLSNVRTHSRAKQALVTLRASQSAFEVEIVDDGPGLSNTSGSQVGHIGIRERVAALGGTTEIGPRPKHGYRVWARIPNMEAK